MNEFSIPEVPDRQELFTELTEIIKYSNINLGGKMPDKQNSDSEFITNQLSKLEKENISFSPKLSVRRLKKSDFDEREMTPSGNIQNLMHKNIFYHIGVPITLFPMSGWAFTRLECWMEFCPNESNTHERALIHDMFPDDVWSEILNFQDYLELGLDENLGFRAVIQGINDKYELLSGAAKAKIALQIGGGAKLVVGPFQYRTRRPDIRGRGRGNVECFWRLDGKKHVDQEDVMLELVLMVPKGRDMPINVIGHARARHDFQFLSADVLKDWVSYFSKKLKTFYEAGLPLSTLMEWENITLGVD